MSDQTPTDQALSAEIVPPHGWYPEDYCPVCKSLDVTFPIGVTWTRCLACRAQWDAARRLVCHVIGCVEHIDGMHVDHLGDALVHVGCSVCSALPHHAKRDISLTPATEGGRDE